MGPFKLYDYIKDSWCCFCSHPADFTPVCTTELGRMANLSSEFKKRGVRRRKKLKCGGFIEWVDVDRNVTALFDLYSPCC